MGKATKSVSKGFKKATKSVGKAFKKSVKSTIKGIGKAIGTIGKVVGKVPGLGSLGKEINRWGEDLTQVLKVMTGEYHDAAKAIQKYKDTVDEFGRRVQLRVETHNLKIEELVDRMDSLIAFDEIFQMAIANRIDTLSASESEELDKLANEYTLMRKQLERMVAQLKAEYDFVIGLTEGAFVQRLVGSLIMITGGLMSDMGDILSGKADSGTWKRIMNVVLMVTAIVIIVVMIILSAGAATPLLWVALVLTSINTFMTLDGIYANGAATGAIMGLLDFLFNDVLNLDDLIGSDFEKFDKDHEDYQDMVGYVQLALAIGSMAAAWGASTPSDGINAGTAANQVSYGNGALTIGDTLQTSSFLGIEFSSYTQIYEAYKIASKVKDVLAQNKVYNDMKDKLKEDYDKLNQAIQIKLDKSMMKHYTDSDYFLQDQQEYIDRYIWSMTSQNMYVDPYGTTPVANMRFTPDKDVRGLSFGFEDLFNEDDLAGSKGYFDSIIYGGK